MRDILIVFFSVLFFLSILVFPFKVRMMGHFNIFELKGFYSIKIIFFKILNGKILMKNGELVMENDANIFDNRMSKKFTRNFVIEILKKIEVKKVEVYFTGGLKENSFSSAMLCGTVFSLVQTAYGFLSNLFEGVKLYEDIEPTFNEDNLELTFDACVSVSLISIFLSLIKANSKTKKEQVSEG